MPGPLIGLAARYIAKKVAKKVIKKVAKKTTKPATKKKAAKKAAKPKRKSSVDPLTGYTKRQIKDLEDPFAATARRMKAMKTKSKKAKKK